MNALIDAIVAAVAAGASEDARAAGAQACRTLLAALEAKEGEPIAAPIPMPATPSPADVAAIVGGLKTLPVEQLLDLAIARLKAALPTGTTVEPVRSLTVPLIPFPRPGQRR